MIPELVGRLPVTTSVDPLDITALRAILTEPRNALIRQYRHLFQMDDVELVFTDDALQMAAEQAIERDTGARGLRSIIEAALLDVMYDIPSRPEVRKVIVDEQVFSAGHPPRRLDRNSEELDAGEDRDLKAAA